MPAKQLPVQVPSFIQKALLINTLLVIDTTHASGLGVHSNEPIEAVHYGLG